MKLPLPRSLSGQTLAVLVCMLAVSHLIGIAIYALDRRAAVASTEAHDFAERVVGMVMLLQNLSPAWHEEIVRESDGRTFHVTLDAGPDRPGNELDRDFSEEIAAQLLDQLPGWRREHIHVSFTETPFIPRSSADAAPTQVNAVAPEADAYTLGSAVFLHISVRLPQGEWLNFVGGMPNPEEFWLVPATAYIVSITFGIGIIAIWLVFRVTAPFRAFAGAADRLGKDIRTEPLPERGPADVAQASRAFNAMQRRVQRLVENRTQILAALSHDLKTSVTLLRLRAELMEDSSERRKTCATLDEMEMMIASVLEFATATLSNEARRRTDLSALLGSICEDLQDLGHSVGFEGGDRTFYTCRRVSLKRAFTNLIDNAVKYGGTARVSLARRGATIIVEIDDDGPGIPEDRHEEIFMPFYRLDESRSPEAGGTGLGLSIAQAVVQGHGGDIGLVNRAGGGLRVRVTLPL